MLAYCCGGPTRRKTHSESGEIARAHNVHTYINVHVIVFYAVCVCVFGVGVEWSFHFYIIMLRNQIQLNDDNMTPRKAQSNGKTSTMSVVDDYDDDEDDAPPKLLGLMHTSATLNTRSFDPEANERSRRTVPLWSHCATHMLCIYCIIVIYYMAKMSPARVRSLCERSRGTIHIINSVPGTHHHHHVTIVRIIRLLERWRQAGRHMYIYIQNTMCPCDRSAIN